MDQKRALDIQQVTNAMDATRQSIQDTVDELKDRVHETADWRSYVVARPVTSVIVAAVCGVALARIVMPAARLARIPLMLAPRLTKRVTPPMAAGTWNRWAGLAGLAAEIATLPSVVSGVRRLLGSISRTRPR